MENPKSRKVEKGSGCRIDLLRHAQTDFNLNGTDTIDIDINLTGILQCLGLIGHYDLVLCSPLKRCLQTLNFSHITYDYLVTVDMLRECKTDHCDFMQDEAVELETESLKIKRSALIREMLNNLKISGQFGKILVVSHSEILWHVLSIVEDDGERYGRFLNNAERCEFLI